MTKIASSPTIDEIVTNACHAVDDLLDECEYSYGIMSCRDWPELRDIVETAILHALNGVEA